MIDDEIRAAFAEGRCHHVVVAGFLAEPAAALLREQVTAAGFVPYDEPDRGRYTHNRELAIPSLFDDLRALSEQLVQRPLRLDHACWLRLQHRDYQLIKDDARDRPVVATHLEVTLDFSALATDQAELVYTDGHESWIVPQVPGALSIVEREPWLFRYARYLNGGVGDMAVHRLRLLLSYLEHPGDPAAASR